jgi:hypothetical protein
MFKFCYIAKIIDLITLTMRATPSSVASLDL